jgi:hypothetical protein
MERPHRIITIRILTMMRLTRTLAGGASRRDITGRIVW